MSPRQPPAPPHPLPHRPARMAVSRAFAAGRRPMTDRHARRKSGMLWCSRHPRPGWGPATGRGSNRMWSSRISHARPLSPMKSCASATTVARVSSRSESFHALRRWLQTPIPFRVLRSYTSFRTRPPVTAGRCDNAYMTDGGDTDEALMLRFAAGEVRAFEELYRRHELRVWRYLQRNLSNRSITDELMQDVWFSVARAAKSYQPMARFTTWLL